VTQAHKITATHGGEGKPSRGRPRDAAKNIAILEAASDLFLEMGFDGTSMDTVARRASVSKQTVYSHFSSKEQLFGEAVHNEIMTHYPERALEGVDNHTLEADLIAVCQGLAKLLMSPRAFAMYRLLVTAAARGPELGQIFWKSGPADILEQLTKLLQSWVDRGELVIEDTQKASQQLVALFKEPAHFKISIGVADLLTTEEINASVEHAVSSFLKIYRAP
jgi:TetR/AcrR family transcriptional repressor of mexJK operon